MGEQPHLIKSAHWVEILSCCFGTGNVVWGAAIIAISIDIRDLLGNQCLLSMVLFYHQMSIFLVNCNNGCQLHPCQFKSASVWSVACKKEFNWKINCDLSARKISWLHFGCLWFWPFLADLLVQYVPCLIPYAIYMLIKWWTNSVMEEWQC